MKQKFRLILLAAILLLNAETATAEWIDIAASRKIYLECQGSGFPTVVLVSGRSDRAAIWQTSTKTGPTVFSEVAKFTKVCAYDRPGTFTIKEDTVLPSRSTTVPQPITPKDGVSDLHALLTAAKIPPPYLLVGHSYGGLIVRLFASSYPNEVVGLVLVDTLTEYLYDALTASQQAQWIRLNSNYSAELDRVTVQERTDFVPSFQQMRAAPAIRPMPVIVLTSDQPYDFKELIAKGILPADTPLDFAPLVFQAHLKAQERLAQKLQAKHITETHAGHYVQTEQPQLVIDAIREVVERVRKAAQN